MQKEDYVRADYVCSRIIIMRLVEVRAFADPNTLLCRQVDLLQALLVKQQPATKPVANPPPAAAVTTTAVNTSLLRPNPTTRSEPHPLGRAIARRQVAEIGTNTSIVWPAPVHTHNGWSSAHVRSTSRGAGEGFSQRGAKAGYSQDEESEAFRKNVSESRTRDRGGLGDATHERVRQGGVGEVRAEPTFEKVQQVAFYQTDYRPKSAEQPPQSSAVETAHKASRFGVESGEPRQRASADVSTGGRGHASGQLPVVPSAWGAGTGVRKNTAAERPEFGVGRNGFTDGEPQGDVSAQRGDVRGDVMEGEEQGWLSSRSSSASSLVLSELGAPLVERTGEDGNFESWRGVGEEAVHAQHLETGSGERSAQGVESLPHGGEMREQSNGSGGIPESESGARWDGFPAVRNRSGAVKNGSGARGKGLAATRNGLEGVEEVRSGAGLAKAAADSLESLKGSTAGRVGARDRDVGEGSRDKGFRSETRNDLQVVRRSKGKLGEEREYCRQGERVEKAVLGGGWGAGTGAPVLKAHLLDIPQIKYMPLSDDEDSDAEETAGRFRTADGVPRGFSVTNGGTSDGLGGQGGRMSGSEGRANVVVPRGSLQERGGFEKERTIERSGLDMTHDGSTYLADLSVDSRRYLTQHGLLQTRSRPPALRPLDEDRVLRNQDPDDSLEMSERGLETGVDATVYEGRGVWGESGGGVQEERSRILRSAQIEECDSSMFLSGTEVRLGGTAGAVSLWANGSVAEVRLQNTSPCSWAKSLKMFCSFRVLQSIWTVVIQGWTLLLPWRLHFLVKV